jgi:hypothetical protein
MKKLILMTSALTMIGGAAVAEITLGAGATLSYGNWGGVPAGFSSSVELTADLAETTASGVTYGASMTFDIDGNAEGTIFVSGDFGKLSYGVDAFGATVTETAGDDSGDLQYEYAMGDFSATFTAETATGAEDADNNFDLDANSWDLAISYVTGAITIGASTDSDAYSDMSVDYDGGSYTAGASFDSASVWDIYVGSSFGDINAKVTYDSASVAGLELDGASGDMGWALSYDSTGATTASVNYAAGDLSVGVAYDSTNAGGLGGDAETILTVGYTISDLASAEVLLNDASEYEVSLTLGFEF